VLMMTKIFDAILRFQAPVGYKTIKYKLRSWFPFAMFPLAIFVSIHLFVVKSILGPCVHKSTLLLLMVCHLPGTSAVPIMYYPLFAWPDVTPGSRQHFSNTIFWLKEWNYLTGIWVENVLLMVSQHWHSWWPSAGATLGHRLCQWCSQHWMQLCLTGTRCVHQVGSIRRACPCSVLVQLVSWL